MFSEEYEHKITEAYKKKLSLLGKKREEIEKKAAVYPGSLGFALKYLYAIMPLSDAANYDFEIFFRLCRKWNSTVGKGALLQEYAWGNFLELCTLSPDQQ